MLLHDSRRDARLDEAGDLVILEEQDRSRWDQRQIAEALPLVEEAFRGGPGPFALQAAIAAVHCRAATAEDTDWPQIVRLYDLLERAAAFADRVAQPGRGGRDGGRTSAGRLRSSTRSRLPAISTAIICCMPRAPICCAASGLRWKRRRATGERSSWSRMTASADFSSGDCAKYRRTKLIHQGV